MLCLFRPARAARPTPVRLALEPLAGRLAPAVLPLAGDLHAQLPGGTDPAALGNRVAYPPPPNGPVSDGPAAGLLPVTDPVPVTVGDGPMEVVWGGPAGAAPLDPDASAPIFIGGIFVG
jgi:hypothetical protein